MLPASQAQGAGRRRRLIGFARPCTHKRGLGRRRGADVGLRANTGPKSAHSGTSAWCQNLTLSLPKDVEHWSLATLREKLVKIGAKMVRHGRYVAFQMAEVAIPRRLFAEILRMIDGLRPKPLQELDRALRGVSRHGLRQELQ